MLNHSENVEAQIQDLTGDIDSEEQKLSKTVADIAKENYEERVRKINTDLISTNSIKTELNKELLALQTQGSARTELSLKERSLEERNRDLATL